MMHRHFVYLMFLLPAGSGLGQASDQLKREINRILEHEQPVDFSVVPGVLIGVVTGDSIYTFAAGQAPEKEAIFELGSVTKPIVAYITYQMLEQAGLKDTLSVCSFLPDSVCRNGWQDISIRQVLSHQCGLPKITSGMAEAEVDLTDPYAEYNLSGLASDLMLIEPTPGQYSYSHLGYMLLYWLFESSGGVEECRQLFLEQPGALSTMKFEVHDQQITPGFGLNGQPRTPWHTEAMALAIGLKSNLPDVMQWMKKYMHDNRNHHRVLSAAENKELNTKAKKGIYELEDGWFLVPSGRDLMYFHTGHTGGHHTSVAFIPTSQIGVAVFSNGAGGSGDLSIRVLEMIARAGHH